LNPHVVYYQRLAVDLPIQSGGAKLAKVRAGEIVVEQGTFIQILAGSPVVVMPRRYADPGSLGEKRDRQNPQKYKEGDNTKRTP
jgi:hypothetical protein